MGVVGVSASRSASASSWEAKEDGVLLRDDEGQASEGSKVRLRSGRALDTRTRSRSYSSAATRSTFLYLKGREGEEGEGQGRKEAENRVRDSAPSVLTFSVVLLSVLVLKLPKLPCLP